jgi:hypothetical protein
METFPLDTTISPDKLKIKVIQGIFKQNIKPKCQIKWEEQYGGNIDWTQIWTKLKKIKVTYSPNIIFNSLISILAVNPDLLNIASISFIILFTEGHLKNRCCIVSSYGGEDLDVIFNTVIFISKWEIWKIHNKVKYNQSRIGDQTIFNTWKNN